MRVQAVLERLSVFPEETGPAGRYPDERDAFQKAGCAAQTGFLEKKSPQRRRLPRLLASSAFVHMPRQDLLWEAAAGFFRLHTPRLPQYRGPSAQKGELLPFSCVRWERSEGRRDVCADKDGGPLRCRRQKLCRQDFLYKINEKRLLFGAGTRPGAGRRPYVFSSKGVFIHYRSRPESFVTSRMVNGQSIVETLRSCAA